jgi:hypothetical protein
MSVTEMPPANQMFGYHVPPRGYGRGAAPTFAGTNEVPVPDGDEPWQIRIYAGPDTCLETFVSKAHHSCVYLWGRPAHPEMQRSAVAGWCADVVAERHFDRFRDLLGTFVAVVDEPKERRVTVITDVLGIRPLFIGRIGDRLAFGSNVWALYRAGASKGECDHDALTAWLAYGYNCTDGSLFKDLRRPSPGTATVFKDGRTEEIPYATLEAGDLPNSPERAAHEIDEIVSASVKALVSDGFPVATALSGGFDSRYLLALGLDTRADVGHVASVRFSQEEGEIADQVAAALRVPLKSVQVGASVWDIYDDVHHFMADGFPISKFVTYCLAQQYPGMPMMNGFLGDSLVRGSHDRAAGKLESEWSANLADVLQETHFAVSLNLFRPSIGKTIKARSRAPMENAVRRGAGKVFGWADLYLRQRCYISNNFLQHLDLAEALLPFYSWALMSYKMRHDSHAFGRDVYHRIFSDRFPTLADIPHSSDLKRPSRPGKPANCMVRWARELIAQPSRLTRLEPLAKHRCVPLVALAASGVPFGRRRLTPIVEDAMLTIRRIDLLEQRVRDNQLSLNWSSL